MWTKLLMGAYFALLISFISSDEFSTERTTTQRKQRFRIVKIYGRKLKTTTPSTITTTPVTITTNTNAPFKFNLEENTKRRNDTVLEEPILPRDMLRRPRDDNVVNVGQLYNMDNFDVSKFLAAAGHSNNGEVDPLTPTIVRFTAPSSGSHLDPEYLTKLIKEQLGNDAQFTILPSSGNEANFMSQSVPKLSNPNQAGYRTTTTQKQLHGGFKESQSSAVPVPASEYFTSPSPKGKNTYPALRINSEYDGTSSKFPVTVIPASYSQSPSPPTMSSSKGPRNFPLYPRNPTNSVTQMQLANFNRFKSQPTSPPSPSTTKHQSTATKSYSIPTAPTSQTFFGHHSSSSGSGYSTLTQSMTPPGLEAAIIGQYGQLEIHKDKKYREENENTKYSATFVRGFTEGTSQESGQNHYTTKTESSNGKGYSSSEHGAWKGLKETYRSPANEDHWFKGSTSSSPFVQEPSQTFTVPKLLNAYSSILPHPSTYEILKTQDLQFRDPTSDYENLNFDSEQRFQPSTRDLSENYESYTPGIHQWDQGHKEDDFALENSSPSTEYSPPPSSSVPLTHSSSSKEKSPIQHNSKPNEHNSPPRSPVTKTIYVNLPSQTPSTTTPIPFHQVVLPQKHYKIIFIKAPTVPPTEEPEVEVTPPPETKTIIYVLHKKPEQQLKKLTLKAPPPTKPPSPEVYFIQYKNKKENSNQRHEGPWERSDESRESDEGDDDSDDDPPPSTHTFGKMEANSNNDWSPPVYSTKSKDQNEFQKYNAEGYPGTQYKMSASSSIVT